MKKTIAWVMALVLCLGVMSAAVLADDTADACPFTYSDGKITGSYTVPGKYVEIWVNDECANIGMGTVAINFRPQKAADSYTVGVYVEGTKVVEYVIDTAAPTATPTSVPTAEPTAVPTAEPTAVPTPVPLTITIDEDGKYATVTGDFSELYARVALVEDGKYATVTGDFSELYARVALVVDNAGTSGLYLTQVPINDEGENGTIVVPAFQIPGLKVVGVNVSLVASLDEITSPQPKPLATDSHFFS